MGRRKTEYTHEEFMQKIQRDEGWYVPNAFMMPELNKCDKLDKITNDMAIIFRAIAIKYANTKKYKSTDDRYDCIMYGVRDCISYWRSFNREELPVLDEEGHPQRNEDGSLILKKPPYTLDPVPLVETMDEKEIGENDEVVGVVKNGKMRVMHYDKDGKVITTVLNPFGYFSSVCIQGMKKAWGELGYKDFPFSERLSLSDNIYSI